MSRRSEIEALTARFARAITSRDFAVLGPHYEPGARFLLPGVPIVEGPAAIQAAQQKMVERGIAALDLQSVDVLEFGDVIFEIGRVTLPIKPLGLMGLLLFLIGKRPWVKHGKSVVVWRRQKGGSLKIMVDTFNGN